MEREKKEPNSHSCCVDVFADPLLEDTWTCVHFGFPFLSFCSFFLCPLPLLLLLSLLGKLKQLWQSEHVQAETVMAESACIS